MTMFDRIKKVLGLRTKTDLFRIETIYPNTPLNNVVRYTIPITGLNPVEAQRQVSELIADYRQEVIFNDKTGEVNIISGNTYLPYSRQVWFPSDNNQII